MAGQLEIGGAGIVGIGYETTVGTFAIPSFSIPIRSENLHVVDDKIWRMNIRGVADRSGVVQGYRHIEGDITFEVTRQSMLPFLYAGRFSVVKSGTTPNFTYTFTPLHVAKTTTATGPTNRRTLSLLIQRSNNPMGYVGCAVGQYAFTLDNGLLLCTASIMGTNEAAQTAAVPVWTGDTPYGPGEVSLEIPTATGRTDVDTFTLTHNDNLTPRFNLGGVATPSYSVWGERELTASFDVDFETLTDYTAFRNQTIQSTTFKGTKSVNDEFSAVMVATVFDTFEVGLSSLGDVVRGAVTMHGFYNSADAITYVLKSNIDTT